MTRIAFVGVGTMGVHMARRLAAAGHEVVACDTDPDRAPAAGTATAATPAEAVEGAAAALLSLPSPAAVETVAGEIAGAAPPGLAVIDLSTSPPALERRLAAGLEARGLAFLDAPVSGGPTGAEAGTLAIMVGGRDDVFAAWEPVLGALGSLVRHVGPAGAGQVVKLCNNLAVACTMAGLAEACAILEREGIDAALAYELFSGSTSDSSVLRRRFPVGGVRPEHPASDGYRPMFSLDLLHKDLVLALDLAREAGVDPAVAREALAAYARAQELGLGGLDYSAVYRAIRRETR